MSGCWKKSTDRATIYVDYRVRDRTRNSWMRVATTNPVARSCFSSFDSGGIHAMRVALSRTIDNYIPAGGNISRFRAGSPGVSAKRPSYASEMLSRASSR